MNNTVKIIVIAALTVIAVSLLWLIIPATFVWIISYIFTIIAIIGIALSFIVYVKKATAVPQGHVFPITAVIYAIASCGLSVAIVLLDNIGLHFNVKLYIIIHTIIFIFFIIRVIILLAGAEHISKVGEKAEKKHKELNKGKENYW
jgi:hypothetical protein